MMSVKSLVERTRQAPWRWRRQLLRLCRRWERWRRWHWRRRGRRRGRRGRWGRRKRRLWCRGLFGRRWSGSRCGGGEGSFSQNQNLRLFRVRWVPLVQASECVWAGQYGIGIQTKSCCFAHKLSVLSLHLAYK